MFGSSPFSVSPFSSSITVPTVEPTPTIPVKTVALPLRWVLISRGNKWILDPESSNWVLTSRGNMKWVLDPRVSLWVRKPQTMKWAIK